MNQTKTAEILETRNAPASPLKQCAKPPEKLGETTIFSKAMLEAMVAAGKAAEQPAQAQGGDPVKHQKAPRIEWDVEGDKVEAKTTVSTVHTYVNFLGDTVKAPDILNLFGIKVDLNDKLDYYKDNYAKNYALSKSHNFLMAKYASLKLGFYGMMLSLCGVSTEEIKELQKATRAASKLQNIRSFEENEYTGELLEIIGGSKKQIKQERMVIGELRKQLTKQMENLGFRGYYDAPAVNEIQTDQCRNIKEKLEDEKNSLEYHAQLIEAGVPVELSGIEVESKLSKMTGLVKRADKRLGSHLSARQAMAAKMNAAQLKAKVQNA